MRLPEKRIIEMKKLIQMEKMVSVERLSEHFGISPITVRRDLARLEEEGFLSKVHGGAIYKDTLTPEPAFNEQIKIHRDEKNKIAKEAAKRIKDGDSIIIESGTTCLSLVSYLSPFKNLKISTAGLPIAIELWKAYAQRQDFEISTCGGTIRPVSNMFVGPHAVNFFKKINVDKAFVSAVAVSLDKGISSGTEYDSEIAKSVIDSAREVILLCDSSKFGRYSYINVAGLDAVDEIITDKGLDQDILEKIKSMGIKTTLV
ncbi:MAG: DeoR/GlpR family DNA-binding transcription regulator [Actinomycetota bacterium]